MKHSPGESACPNEGEQKGNRKELPAKRVKDLAEMREGFELSFYQLDDPVTRM